MSSRKFILSIIEQYRNHPCLWQVTHKDYRNQFKRNEALKELLILFKARDKQSNFDTVRKKIVSLRSSFMKELNKVRKSMQSKSESDECDDIHIPKLWYYNEMAFLIDVCSPGGPSPNNQELLIVKDDKVEITDEENQSDDLPPSPLSSDRSFPAIPIITNTTSKPTRGPINYPLPKKTRRTHLSSSLRSSNSKYAAYGEHIAEKLRSMADLMATYCQKLINDAIFLAATNNLDIGSQIINNQF